MSFRGYKTCEHGTVQLNASRQASGSRKSKKLGEASAKVVSFAPSETGSKKSSAFVARHRGGYSTEMAFLGKNGKLRKPQNLTLLEKKALFLGRFLTRNVDEAAFAKIRSVIRLNRGIKTRLKLTSSGLISGNKSNGLLRNKVPYEFAPMKDVADIIVDENYQDVLLVVYRLTLVQYEIVAYRMENQNEAEHFSSTFGEIANAWSTDTPSDYLLHGQRSSLLSNPRSRSLSSSETNNQFVAYKVESEDRNNWTYANNNSWTTANNNWSFGEKALPSFMMPSPVQSDSSSGSSQHRTPKHRSLQELTLTSGRSTPEVVSIVTPSSMITYRDVAVSAKLTDPRDFDRKQKTRMFFDRIGAYTVNGVKVSDAECQVYTKPPKSSFSVTINPKLDIIYNEDSVDHKENTSPRERQMRKDIDNLQEEVRFLRSLLGTAGVYKKDSSDQIPPLLVNGYGTDSSEGYSQSYGMAEVRAYVNRPEEVKPPLTESFTEKVNLLGVSANRTNRANQEEDLEAMTTSIRRLHQRPPSASRMSQVETRGARYPFQHPPVDKRRSRSADLLLQANTKDSRSNRGQIYNAGERTSRSRVKGTVKDHLNADRKKEYLLFYTQPVTPYRSHSSSRYDHIRQDEW